MRAAVAGLQLLLLLTVSACQSTASELNGLGANEPLDYSVLVTGGTFLAPGPAATGTFAVADEDAREVNGTEAIGLDEVVGILETGRVFRRVAMEEDEARRRLVCDRITAGAPPEDMREILQRARDDGFDFLLVIEELRDGPIEGMGINGRWPVTFATWILLGVGALALRLG